MTKRLSNIELLRIVCMFMVLCLHADFMALGFPSHSDVDINPISTEISIFIELLCIVAVDVFVMISGWFGIKPSIKGFCNFMWQVIFIIGLLTIFEYSFLEIPLNRVTIMQCFGLYNGGRWFVNAYIGLYVLSPILNAFINHSSSKQIVTSLVGLYVFQTIFGLTDSSPSIRGGYSTFSFIGLYIFSSYLHKIQNSLSIKRIYALIIIPLSINFILYNILLAVQADFWANKLILYINPLVIIQAAGVILLFSRIRISNRISMYINYIASSCFAAYLLHAGKQQTFELYYGIAKDIYSYYDGIKYFGAIMLYMIAVYILAIILDQPRKLIWNRFLKRLF